MTNASPDSSAVFSLSTVAVTLALSVFAASGLACDVTPADEPALVKRDATADQTTHRVFDGDDDAARVGLPRSRTHDYVETCGADNTCSLWDCPVGSTNAGCALLGSYDDEGLDPAAASWDSNRAPAVPELSFVSDDNEFVTGLFDAAEEGSSCHENSGSVTMCAINKGAGTLHCSVTVCGITSHYVCCGTAETDCIACE